MVAGDSSGAARRRQSDVFRESKQWDVIVASVRGMRHQKPGQPYQEAYYWSMERDSVLVAAVADAAYSAHLGEVGATIAAYTAVTALSTRQQQDVWPQHDDEWHSYLTDAMQAAQAALAIEADTRHVEIRDLATTLILVVATSDLVVAAQIGDGAAVVGDQHGHVSGLTVPQRDEEAPETTFLISPEAFVTAQLSMWHGTPAYVAIFSDGLQYLRLSMPEGLPYAPFFRPFFRFVSTLRPTREARGQVDVCLRSPPASTRMGDDSTLLLATLGRWDQQADAAP